MTKNDFIVNRCGMVVLSICMLFWTTETRIAIKEGGLKNQITELQA